MEGKAVLFKRFADVDGIDLEVDTQDVDEFVNCVRYLGPTFGGINLEDIKAPECFIIEQRLRELMDIPVFHDDQHGTAIIAAAGLINALDLTGRDIKDTRMVVNGAGAAGDRLRRADQGHGHAARERHPVRHQGRHLAGPHRGHEPVEVAPTPCAPRRARWPKPCTAPTCSSACRPRARSRKEMVAVDGRPSRSSSPWPTPIPRSRPRTCARSAPTRSSPPAAATTRTRSTTCWASPTSSAARSTCAPAPSTRR